MTPYSALMAIAVIGTTISASVVACSVTVAVTAKFLGAIRVHSLAVTYVIASKRATIAMGFTVNFAPKLQSAKSAICFFAHSVNE